MRSPFSDSMFQTLSSKIGPTPDELRDQAQAMQRESKVIFKGYHAEVYNLGSDTERKAYAELMEKLVTGMAARTHVLFHKDRQFVQATATWMVNLEWGEFELVDTPVKTVGTPEVAEDGKDKIILTQEDITNIERMGLET